MFQALFYAANSGYMSMVTELKKAGANIKHRDNRKDSAADVAYSRAFDKVYQNYLPLSLICKSKWFKLTSQINLSISLHDFNHYN